MRMKKISLDKRKEYIEALKAEIAEQQRIVELIEWYKPTTLQERIIHAYAVEGSVTAVADQLNEDGLRIEGRKYTSNDITAVIMQKPSDQLHESARKAFDHNKKGLRY